MARSTGIVLATGGIVVANELLFAPVARTEKGDFAGSLSSFNWRVIPATAILALTLAGLEKASPEFAVGLASLALLSILIVPYGNAGTPIQNIAATIGVT